MAFTIPTGDDAELIAEFRKRAHQITAHAATQEDVHLRKYYLDIAVTYQRMAEHLEKKMTTHGVARALQMPEQQQAGADIAAAAAPPLDPPKEDEPKG